MLFSYATPTCYVWPGNPKQKHPNFKLWRHGHWILTFSKKADIYRIISNNDQDHHNSKTLGSKLCGTQALRSVKKPNLTVAPMYSHRVQIHLTLMNLSFVAPNVVVSPAKNGPWSYDRHRTRKRTNWPLSYHLPDCFYMLLCSFYFCFTGLNPQKTWNIHPPKPQKLAVFTDHVVTITPVPWLSCVFHLESNARDPSLF